MIIDDLAVVCGLPAVLYFLFPKQVIVQRGCKCTGYRAGSMLSGCDGAERLRFSIERCVRLFLVLPSAWTKSVHNFLPIDVSCSIYFLFFNFFVFSRKRVFLKRFS